MTARPESEANGSMSALAPPGGDAPRPVMRLRVIKLVHTAIWAVFAACIVGIPVASWRGAHATALILVAIVAVEVLILMFNRWSCPLTAVAARHTANRRDNFDIYLPLWLARYNKQIFGPLYVVGALAAVLHWLLE